MKAFLLAAGEGTRLRPFTNDSPKCLIPINGRPLLSIWLELCEQHGVDDVLINLHWKADAVRRFVSQTNWRLKINLFEEPRLLGSAGTIAANETWIGDDDRFWVLYADVLTNVNLRKMMECHRRHHQPFTIGLVPTDQPHRCGIATLDETGLVTSFEEKPKEPKGDLAFSGVFLATRALYQHIPACRPVDLGGTVLPRLTGQMHGHLLDEFLLDIGTLQNYETAQRTWPGIEGSRPERSRAAGTGQ